MRSRERIIDSEKSLGEARKGSVLTVSSAPFFVALVFERIYPWGPS